MKLTGNLTRRPETAEDEPFLRQMTIASLNEELMASSWPQATRDFLLPMQYTQKMGSLRANYPDGTSEIIELDGKPVGWIFVATLPDRIHLCEIMVLMEMRGKGVAGTILKELLDTANQAGKPVTLLVSTMNARAQRLYEKAGFKRTGGDEVQHQMEWIPQSS